MISIGFARGYTPKLVIGRYQERLDNLFPAMKAVGAYLVEESIRQFEVGGDPSWAELAESTKKQKEKRGYTNILVNLALLKNSVNYSAFNRSVLLFAAGVYALIHQFGGMAGRGKKTEIPARPYVRVGATEMKNINEIISDYIKLKRQRMKIRF